MIFLTLINRNYGIDYISRINSGGAANTVQRSGLKSLTGIWGLTCDWIADETNLRLTRRRVGTGLTPTRAKIRGLILGHKNDSPGGICRPFDQLRSVSVRTGQRFLSELGPFWAIEFDQSSTEF